MSGQVALDMSNPANVLATAMRAENSVALLQTQVKGSMENLLSRVDAMHADARETSRNVTQLAQAMHDMQGHSEGLNRLALALERKQADDDKRWAAHEEANRQVADRVNTFKGVLIGFGVAGSLLLTAVVTLVEFRFSQADERAVAGSRIVGDRLDNHVSYGAEAKAQLEANINQLRADVDELQKTKGLK